MIRSVLQTSLLLAAIAAAVAKDTQCYWKTHAGATYDLRGMTIGSKDKCYHIKAGDIECTPEEEPSYNYQFNFCSTVPSQCLPSDCKDKSPAAVMQYLGGDCWVAGTYDPDHDDAHYALLDPNDPTAGVSMTYRSGDGCRKGNNVQRTTTIDVQCADVSPPYVEDATEPSYCQYHLTVKSTYGCPKECAVTKHGLCGGHGKCMYDSSRKEAYCYCNKGYSGSECTKSSGEEEQYDGYSVQLGLTIVLLIVTLALLGVVGFFIYKLYGYRQETQYVHLAENEMTAHDTF